MNGSRELTVAHHHPGRLRLRSRAFEGEDGARSVADASTALGAVSGVRDVHVSAVTGSVLVLYDPENVDTSALVDAAARSAGITVETADVVLVDGGITKLPRAFALADGGMASVKRSLGLVIVPNALAILLGAFGWIGPATATVINNGSTVAAALAGVIGARS
jgi:cation transport ATPase